MFCCCTLRDTCFEKYGVVNCLSPALAWPQQCAAQVKSGGVRDLPLLLCHATVSTQRENLHSARHICATCKGVWKTVGTLFLETWSHVCLLTCQFSSVAQSCPSLCDPMDCSTPGLPVHCQLPEFTQTHVHWGSDAIQPSHLLSSPSPPDFNLLQHQGLF